MNNSTLPPLMGNHLLSHKPRYLITSPRVEDVRVEQDKNVNCSSNELEKKQKNSRSFLEQQRLMEAEEKASKERDEKALHTLRMWNIVKQNERWRKQKMLKDRVDLQHQIIKKQDELHEILEKQQREDKDLHQSSCSKFQQKKLSVGVKSKAHHKLHKRRRKAGQRKSIKNNPVDDRCKKQTILEACEDEDHLETSHKDTFSEEDLSEFVENSTMEDVDFQDLRQQPLKVQLEKLLGDRAESYLNPTLKERPRKVLDPAMAKRKGMHGVTALWESLRDYSRQKLRNKDALILPDVKNAYACFARECLRRHITPVKRNFVSEEETPVNVNVEESDLLKDVRYRRHRQELMYRIAHINKDKTKLLFQSVGPPYYVDMKTQEGLRRYYPQLTENKTGKNIPSIFLEDDQRRRRTVHVSTNLNCKPPTQVKSKYNLAERRPRVAGSKLVFLAEEMASARGKFRKRSLKEVNDEGMNTDLRQSKSIGVLSESNTKKPEFVQRPWEPLSMDALLDLKGIVF